jgi:hypothetical protein
MSRKPFMSEEEMKAMYARAADAGMNKYGASEEQMHMVARRDENEPPIDNFIFWLIKSEAMKTDTQNRNG